MQGLPPDIDFRILGDEMARKRFGFENLDVELEKLSENDLNKYNNIKKENFMKSIHKIKTKLNRNDSELRMFPSSINRSKKLNQYSNSKNEKKENSETGKLNQEGNSNIIYTNTNINTNINTATNVYSNSNTNMNNYINTNNNDIDNDNEKDIYLENNSLINENSSSISNNVENKNININIDESETSINQIIQKNKDITVEIVDPSFLKLNNDNYFDDINIDVNTQLNINKNIKKSKIKHATLYEREMKNRKRKNEILDKKRNILNKNEEKKLKCPEMDPNSQSIIEMKGIYVPIDKRAANIHSMKISQRILNEENNKIKKKKEEDELINKYKNKKKFNKGEWNDFLDRQYQWKDKIEYKKKAADILKNNIEKKQLFKPKINHRSRSIIKDIQNGNESLIDEVFIRLYNDFEEHKERQKFRNEQSLPSFKPILSKNCSQKNLNCNLKIPYRSGTTPLINCNNNINLKKKYSIASINMNENKNSNKAKSEKLFYDLFNNNIEKYLNTNKNGNIKQINNKSQGTTQPTNITNTNANYTDINTDIINSKYIILEKPLTNENITKNTKDQNINQKKPFLPLTIKKMIEENCKEQEEENDNKNDNIEKDNKNIKSNFNYNTNGILEESNYEEGNSNFKKNVCFNEDKNSNKDKENEKEENENEDYNIKIKHNEQEGTNKQLSNISSIKDINIVEKINELDKGKKFYGQSQNETINSDDSKYSENKLYKLNIRNTTPFVLKQDVILASKDYSDFFDVPDIDEDF